MRILVKGAGVAGLVLAHELACAGATVTLADRADEPGKGASGHAGGMLAPWCESETAPPEVLQLGEDSARWWAEALPGHVTQAGTLAVSPARDAGELKRLAARTTGHRWVDGDDLGMLEPHLAGRFRQGLFFEGEAHLDPRKAMRALATKLPELGVTLAFGEPALRESEAAGYDQCVDCTGAGALGEGAGLRGVRGEMLVLETGELTLSRPVRLMHPRIPLYIVPRGERRFMVGATMIESEDAGPVSARSLMELLNAAYALHPAFAEARVVETGAGLRPAYGDNLPRFTRSGDTSSLNGFYRHGFLLAPAYARIAARELGVIP